jgi:hypothetical protein
LDLEGQVFETMDVHGGRWQPFIVWLLPCFTTQQGWDHVEYSANDVRKCEDISTRWNSLTPLRENGKIKMILIFSLPI